MRKILALAALLAGALPAAAQTTPLGTGISSGIGASLDSGLQGGLGSGFTADLGAPSTRTLADPFNPNAPVAGGGCAPGQSDPDHTGCRPSEWRRGEGQNPNRVTTYTGDSAFRSTSGSRDPNRIETYTGDSAFR